MKSLKLSSKKIGNKTLTTYVASAYLLILFLIYPFFMPKGYISIDHYKFTFFLYSSLGAVLLLLLTGLVEFGKEIVKITITDIFVLLFIIITAVSFYISDYRQNAFLGADGWYMGFLSLLLICFLYFLISRLWEYEGFVLPAMLVGAFAVFFLGFADRFSMYILPLEVRDPGFISTIGNINWFMGFFAVFSPIGIVMFLRWEKDEKIRLSYLRVTILGVYVLMCFMVGLVQGADSVFLLWVILFVVLLILSFKKIVSMERIAILIGIWGVAGIADGIICRLKPDGFNYDVSCLGYRICVSAIPFYALGVSILLILLLRSMNSEKVGMAVSGVLLGLMAFGVLFLAVVGILKTNTGMIKGFEHSIFYFDDRFGSGRGFAYRTAFELIKRMSLREIFFGVGPDCFANFAYSFDDISSSLKSVWPGEFLLNAHCELLNMFINEGILGFLSYLGIFVGFLISVGKKLRDKFILGVFVSVICYVGHNTISFAQILNTPYIFVLMGMAVSRSNSTLSIDSSICKK